MCDRQLGYFDNLLRKCLCHRQPYNLSYPNCQIGDLDAIIKMLFAILIVLFLFACCAYYCYREWKFPQTTTNLSITESNIQSNPNFANYRSDRSPALGVYSRAPKTASSVELKALKSQNAKRNMHHVSSLPILDEKQLLLEEQEDEIDVNLWKILQYFILVLPFPLHTTYAPDTVFPPFDRAPGRRRRLKWYQYPSIRSPWGSIRNQKNFCE